jgi:hypothetical protein
LNTLIPKCREAPLRARGVCTDDRAGPKPLTNMNRVPPALGVSGGLVARDLRFEAKTTDRTRISAAESQPAPFLYEFRIAHN